MKKLLYLCVGASTMYDSQIPEQLKQFEKYVDVTKCYLLYAKQNNKISLVNERNSYKIILTKKNQLLLMLGMYKFNSLIDLNSYDYIYCRGHFAGYVGLKLKERNKLKSKLLVDFRAMIIDELAHERGLLNKIKLKFYNHAEGKIVRKCSNVFVVSNNFRKYIEQKYGEQYGAKIIQIRPFVNRSKFKFSESIRKKMRRLLKYKPTDKVLIYVGGTSWWQCIDETLLLFKNINKINSNTKMLFITADIKIASNKVKNIVLANMNIKILKLPNDEVFKYLCAADFGMLLRRNELTNMMAYPTKFSEYMLCGLPTIITKTIGCFQDCKKENSVIIDLNHMQIEQLNLVIQSRKFNREKISSDYASRITNEDLYRVITGTKK
jgi:glycosyltransferase involved in cell wall biosynthesis